MALKPPSWALVHKTTYAPMFFVPQMALAYRLDAISQGPKNSRIPGPNPLPFALVMDAHNQNIMHGAVCINHRCIISYSSSASANGEGRMNV
jgi:hypothetical protein